MPSSSIKISNNNIVLVVVDNFIFVDISKQLSKNLETTIDVIAEYFSTCLFSELIFSSSYCNDLLHDNDMSFINLYHFNW